MSEENSGSDNLKNNSGSSGWGDLGRNIILSVVSLFFGSFLFSGLIEGYKDDLSSKRAIVTEQFRPMRATAVACHNAHNKLVLEYGNLAGAYALMFNELKRIANEGDALGPNYMKFAEAALSGQTDTGKRVDALKNEVSTCYDKLWLQYEEVSIFTSSHDDFIKISTPHFEKINKIYRDRQDGSKKITGDADFQKTLNNFVGLLSSRDVNKSVLKEFMEKNQELFKIPVDVNIFLSENEERIFQERDKIMEEEVDLFARKTSRLFDEGFFHRVFGVI